MHQSRCRASTRQRAHVRTTSSLRFSAQTGALTSEQSTPAPTPARRIPLRIASSRHGQQTRKQCLSENKSRTSQMELSTSILEIFSALHTMLAVCRQRRKGEHTTFWIPKGFSEAAVALTCVSIHGSWVTSGVAKRFASRTRHLWHQLCRLQLHSMVWRHWIIQEQRNADDL